MFTEENLKQSQKNSLQRGKKMEKKEISYSTDPMNLLKAISDYMHCTIKLYYKNIMIYKNGES